jgi:hypothetical protein
MAKTSSQNVAERRTPPDQVELLEYDTDTASLAAVQSRRFGPQYLDAAVGRCDKATPINN